MEITAPQQEQVRERFVDQLEAARRLHSHSDERDYGDRKCEPVKLDAINGHGDYVAWLWRRSP